MRVCQPGPVARQRTMTSAGRRNEMSWRGDEDLGRPPLLTTARASMSSVSSGSSSYSARTMRCASTREKSDFEVRRETGLFTGVGLTHAENVANRTTRRVGHSGEDENGAYDNRRVQPHHCEPASNSARCPHASSKWTEQARRNWTVQDHTAGGLPRRQELCFTGAAVRSSARFGTSTLSVRRTFSPQEAIRATMSGDSSSQRRRSPATFVAAASELDEVLSYTGPVSDCLGRSV